MTGEVITTLEHGVQTIQILRPEKKNALSATMYEKLVEALGNANADKAVHVVTITGSGDSFTSGNDITDFLERDKNGGPSSANRFIQTISTVTKPMIAAVNGLAVGIGVTMLLHCDLVYASETATFQLPFTNLGLAPEAGSSMLLPQLVGYQKAAELMLLGERFSAEVAQQIGLVNAVFAGNALLDEARNRALVIAAKPPASVLATKALLKTSPEAMTARLTREGAVFAALLESPDTKRMMRAFMERRKAG